MTDIAPELMARFTPEAAARFDEYLAQTRAALEGHAELNPDDVEQDVRAHVAAEFPAGAGWVRLDQLEAVLARLGRPEQWFGDGGRPPWQRGVDWVRSGPRAARRLVRGVAARLRDGPDDWRLAYLTFGLLLAGVIVFPLLVVLLPASYLLARAAVALARERGKSLGPQRWLVYPPLVLVSLPLLVGLLVWPLAPAGEIANDVWRGYRADIQDWLGLPRELSEFLLFSYFIAGAVSLWGLIVGLVFWSFPRLPAAVFAPFFPAGGRRLGRALAVLGGVVFTLWLAYTVRTFPVGEWARDWRSQALDDNRQAAILRDAAESGRGDVPVGQVREALEQRGKKVATDFLRACRNRDAGGAFTLADVPFYTGPRAGLLLQPDAEPVIRDRGRLWSFVDAQLRQVQRTDQMPAEALRAEPYEVFKVGADATSTMVPDDVLGPTDLVVTVGRDGREMGRVFVRYRNRQIKVVGMTR
jgi:hypothetical protein